MKKFIYLFIAIIGLAFTACEPMEDIHDEIDSEIENRPIEGSVENYELTDEDYEFLELSFGNFDNEEAARELIPVLLDERYPVWGDGSLINATFKLYNPLMMEEYEVTEEDYAAIELEDDYFSNSGQIHDFLSYAFPNAEQGLYVELTYDVVSGEEPYEISDDDFELIVEELTAEYPDQTANMDQHGNFERRESNNAYWTNDMILEAINVVLLENLPGIDGQKYNVSYAIYDGSPGTESMTVMFNGNEYVAVSGQQYELTTDDFDAIGEEFAEAYPDPAANAAEFHSFDIQEGGDNSWTEEMILEAVNFILMENYADAEDGARFELNYGAYNGSGVVGQSMSVILQDDAYVIDQESSVSTVEETKVYVYNEGWDTPLTLEAEDYTDMGQSFPNFDDEEEALYKIGIFLGEEFPYAEEGDFAAVSYDFYAGETTTEYANYRFENGSWNYIPSVINQTLQFGHDGESWVPDNTIRYSLTADDFVLISETFNEEYPDPAWSAGNYENFDRREGNVNYWSNEMILEAINVVLNDIDPNAEDGQQYVISYDIYNGTNTTESMSVIKEGGEWIMSE